MNKRRAIIGAIVVCVLAVGAAWAFGFFHRTDPAVAKLQEISSQLQDRNLSETQRNQLRGELRDGVRSLNPDQRRAFSDANRGQWMGWAQQRMDEYFAMSKADQQKRLDEILDRMVQAQKSRESNANGNNQQAQQNRGRGWRNMTDAQREQRSKQRLDRTTPKMRAQFAQFRQQLQTRAQERGIDLSKQRMWGFGGGRRGA
ncbi:MAG TPA: hypothetical protein VHE81_12090 [Lacipirellulaceae bacterium]|nr:hypothetical protein [Lacipirellulaceae bacterium]